MTAKTTIYSNGSKWAGEEPDTIDTLLATLDSETLDPKFERYGDFHYQEGGSHWFFGNFQSASHVFRIETTDQDVIDKLVAAIDANKATASYRAAREGMTCGESTTGPDNLVRPCVLPLGHESYHSTGR